MKHRYRLLLLCIACLASSVILLQMRAHQVYGLATWWPLFNDPIPRISSLFFSVSLILAAFWSLSASTHQLLYLWASLVSLTAIHFCLDTFIPFYWRSSAVAIYANAATGYFGFMIFVGVSAHLLHLLLTRKYGTRAEQGAAANP
jgi:hypothetical protein